MIDLGTLLLTVLAVMAIAAVLTAVIYSGLHDSDEE